MERPRLLIATDCFIPRWDGIARFLVEVLPFLREQYDITVIAPDFKGDAADIEGITVVRVPLANWSVGDFPVAQTRKDILRKHINDADIVFTQTIAAIGGNAMRIAKHLKKPLISYVHSIEWELVSKSMSHLNLLRKPARILTWFAAKWLYGKCSNILVPSEEVEEIFRYRKMKNNMSIIPLGVDHAIFTPPHNKRAAKQRLGIKDSDTVIGFVGRLAREKDLLTLYRAFISLQRDFKDIKLLVVGGGVVDFIDHLKNRRGVILVGAQNNVVPYYQAMDIYVLPSLLETTSLTTLEAMSCGVAPVCTPVGAVKHYVKERENGLIFPKGNSLVLGLKLKWLLENDLERRRMGNAARESVQASFTWKKTAEQIENVLQEYV